MDMEETYGKKHLNRSPTEEKLENIEDAYENAGLMG